MTVGDVMKLPSMLGAEVIAGRGGLSRLVESVSVLECGLHTEALSQFYQDGKFDGNELLISSLATISDNVEAQCENIRKRHFVGTVGLVLYNVGVIVPEIDQRLIDLCNQLDFVLICMPRGQAALRYSELIREVLFTVYREQEREQFFVSTLLERISGLPAQQRNMETLLRMLSEHLRVSVILAERQRGLNTTAFWPRSMGGDIAKQLPGWLEELNGSSKMKVPLGDEGGYLQSCPNLLNDSEDLRLFILKYQEPLPENTLWQASECVRLFIHIWDKNLGKLLVSELVRAIINDDSIHKEYLAQLFRVRIRDLNQMWLFIPRHEQAEHDEKLLRSCTDYFSAYPDPVLVSYYEEILVVFTRSIPGEQGRLGPFNTGRCLEDVNRQYEIICCDSLHSSIDARQAYLLSMAHWRTSRKIYRHARTLRTPDIVFAKLCLEIMENPDHLKLYRQIADCLKSTNSDLLPTLAAYLLDASSNIVETAKLLYVHLNTVKYRLRKVLEATGFSPTQMPGAYSLYIAAAIDRISGDYS